MRALRRIWETDPRKDPNPLVYGLLAIAAIAYPIWAQASTGGQGDFLISFLADGGVYVLLAIGLNVVVGFAGLLDLGYAAFFAIGAYTYAFLASDHLTGGGDPSAVLDRPVHRALRRCRVRDRVGRADTAAAG